MTESPLARIVEIAENGRHIAKDRGFLTVSASGTEIGRVPLDDIGSVIATAPGTSVTCALIAELAERGTPLVICGANFSPAAFLWPVATHHAQQRRMEAQIASPPELRAAIWGRIVAAKVRAQGAALAACQLRSGAFERLARLVTDGDPSNVEARAARRYWPALFGPTFRRDPAGGDANSLLNYGYAILRAATARSIVAAGLHPGIGVFHRHPGNPMPLADDLMEPFRPLVDLRVRTLINEGRFEVDPVVKKHLAGTLVQDLVSDAGHTPVSTCLIRLAQSVSASFTAGRVRLDLPRSIFSDGQQVADDDGDDE